MFKNNQILDMNEIDFRRYILKTTGLNDGQLCNITDLTDLNNETLGQAKT